MSLSYRKVLPPDFMFRTYGFKKVSPDELEQIVSRLQKQTYSTEFIHSQVRAADVIPTPRPLPSDSTAPAALCPRAQSARSEFQSVSARPKPCSATPEQTDLIFRRLRRPTVSYRAAVGKIPPNYEVRAARARRAMRKPPPLPKEQTKAIARVRRPTTASRYRFGQGSRGEKNLEKYQEFDFSDDRYAQEPEVEKIFDRLRTPTLASEGGIGPTCPRRRDSIGRRARSAQLPLVSGLPRSRDVTEIVDRLSQPSIVYIHNRCRPTSAMPPPPPSPRSYRRAASASTTRTRRAAPRSAHALISSGDISTITSGRTNTTEVEACEPEILEDDSSDEEQHKSARKQKNDDVTTSKRETAVIVNDSGRRSPDQTISDAANNNEKSQEEQTEVVEQAGRWQSSGSDTPRSMMTSSRTASPTSLSSSSRVSMTSAASGSDR